MKFITKVTTLMSALACILCVYLSSFFKISFILGSQKAFFNGTSVSMPLIGYFASNTHCAVVSFVRLCALALATHSFSFHLLAFVVPGFCASLYWSTKHSLIRFWLPLACMIAFVAHPVGSASAVYSLYWLIPLAIYALNVNSVWTRAIGSTFVAHAVGSVIWIYTLPTTAALWTALLPIVAVERIICAAGMVSVCYAYTLCTTYINPVLTRLQVYVRQYLHA